MQNTKYIIVDHQDYSKSECTKEQYIALKELVILKSLVVRIIKPRNINALQQTASIWEFKIRIKMNTFLASNYIITWIINHVSVVNSSFTPSKRYRFTFSCIKIYLHRVEPQNQRMKLSLEILTIGYRLNFSEDF